MKPTSGLTGRSIAIAMLLLLMSLPLRASGQVVIPRGRLEQEGIRQTRGLRFVPTNRALLWLPGDTLLITHYEVYSSGFAFLVNCDGSGFFKVPVQGGNAVAYGEPFCQLQASPTTSPDGTAVLFFGEPAYGSNGVGMVKTSDAAMLRMDMFSSYTDTLKTGCGSGVKEVALSSTGRLAWTGPCRDSLDIARDPSCALVAGRRPSGCRPDDRDGIYVRELSGGEVRRAGGPVDVDAHEPNWSPDGTSIAFSVGANPLPGRWEVAGAQPGDLMIADASGARALGVAGESASWSPDGATIAYYGDDRDDPNERYGGPRIYLVHPDGTNRRRVFMNDDVTTYPEFFGAFPINVRGGKAFGPLVWSPDGRWLAFARQYEEGASVWRVEVSSGRVERVTVSEQ